MTADARINLSGAVQSALNFLLKSQDNQGAWKDFLLPAGNSNVWVTAYVGDVLAIRSEEEARKAARAGWQFLEKAMTEDGGWSYNAQVPGDADSTLWGLRLAESLDMSESDSARKAGEFLERHVRDDGGLTTYASPDPVRNYIGLPPFVSFKGWTQSHVCVTAACANLNNYRERFRQYLLRKQSDDGKWAAYWWFDDEYATAEAVAALAGKGRAAIDSDPETASRIERAASWALNRVNILAAGEGRFPPAFALAHALRILARTNHIANARDGLSKGVARLVEWQKPDGSWAASARLRVPRPDGLNPDPKADWKMWAGIPTGPVSLESVLKHTFNNYSPDHFGVYTTATVLKALQEIPTLARMAGSD
jgi:squalene cyclase